MEDGGCGDNMTSFFGAGQIFEQMLQDKVRDKRDKALNSILDESIFKKIKNLLKW